MMEHSITTGANQTERTEPRPGPRPCPLDQQTAGFLRKGGSSAEVKSAGFQPAFLDHETGRIYRACFANGLPAPMHVLDGFPDELVVARDTSGRITAVKKSMTSGFLRCGRFYTRAEAARIADESDHH